jgi:ring-1,2-phenylacetyl-CoA epoxidase subunit PaaD
MVTAAAPARNDERLVREALADVPDPEIPVVSVVDLGMVHRIDMTDARIRVDLLPTFIGCPALDVIRATVEDRLAEFGRPVDVRFTYDVPWTSDRITSAGRQRLRESGFAPPDDDVRDLCCPWCGSANVSLDNLFGPTQCRSVHYCRACRQPFEAFKRV